MTCCTYLCLNHFYKGLILSKSHALHFCVTENGKLSISSLNLEATYIKESLLEHIMS